MSLILDGTNGVTYPIGSGTQGAQSKVLQVVQGTLTSTASTSSSSFVTTGLSASITPLFNTSKVLIYVFSPCDNSSASQQIATTIYRNSTNLAGSTNSLANIYSSARSITTISMGYLDSPATTSSITYAAYFASQNGGSVVFNQSASIGTSVSTIILMEIAA